MFKKLSDKVVEATKKTVQEHSEDIADIAITIVEYAFICGAAYSIGSNLVPKRNNIHIYVHMR